MIPVPPHSTDAEVAVLGACLLEPGTVDAAADLQPADFYVPAHAAIWAAMCDLSSKGEPIDLVTVADRLTSMGAAGMVAGGPDGVLTLKLASLVERTSHIKQVDHYVGIIADKATLRRLQAIGAELAAGEHSSADDAITAALTRVQGCYRSRATVTSLRSLAAGYIGECEARHRGELPPQGVPTGFADLDALLPYRGLPRQLLTTLAAQTSKGKSALAQAIIRNAARAGHRVLHVTLEDRASAVVRRHFSAESKIQNRQLAQRRVEGEEWHRLMAAGSAINDYGARVDLIDERSANVHAMLALVRRQLVTTPYDLIVLDYLQLVESGSHHAKRQDEVDAVFGAIEQFSGAAEGTATLLVSQMARHLGRPTIDKLYHSAKLEQGSHTVLLIWDALSGGDCMAVDVAKNKDGPTGLVVLGWDGSTVRFYNAPERQAERYRAKMENIKEER